MGFPCCVIMGHKAHPKNPFSKKQNSSHIYIQRLYSLNKIKSHIISSENSHSIAEVADTILHLHGCHFTDEE